MPPQSDFKPESRVIHVAVADLVAMRDASVDFVDSSGAFGLGAGDLLNLRVPVFQRGLKWNDERVTEFHASLIQGWPVGVLVIAIQEVRLLSRKTGQRRISLSLIDGQQRTWALRRMADDFWAEPWYKFASPKWEALGPKSGPIVDAGTALTNLAEALGCAETDLQTAIREIAKDHGRDAFGDYVDFLQEALIKLTLDPKLSAGKRPRTAARDLAAALVKQHDELLAVRLPILLLGEALEPQLPTIFRRLNEGVPLKGYDLLAAIWERKRLHFASATAAQKRFLQDVRSVADGRIADTYPDDDSGYALDPNLEPLALDDLSLFDLMYYMSKKVNGPTFSLRSDVLAFQVSALVFSGSISKVDLTLSEVYPTEPGGSPDISVAPKLFFEAARNVVAALKPMMDVTSSGIGLRGRVGLTAAVVYLSGFLTHHNRIVQASGTHLTVRRRGASAEDRMLVPGEFLTASQRAQRLKDALPAWHVHDSLTSIFSGSRAYEAANGRVWKEYARASGKGKRSLVLQPSNEMLTFPTLLASLAAFRRLWESETNVDKTPQRRRASDGAAVLLRAAFSHLKVHDTVIDHVIPLSRGRAAAAKSLDAFPLNHVANLMPLSGPINNSRKDDDWSDFSKRLTTAERKEAKASLLIRFSEASSSCLATRASFVDFLRNRYRALVTQALLNLGLPEWASLDDAARDEALAALTAD